MEKFLKYIGLMICALSAFSCSLEEAGPDGTNSGTTIEFIARPTSFTTCDVATKAAAEPWESEIKTSYMLLYDAEGDLKLGPVALGNNPAYKYATDGDYTVCFLANVPSDFMERDFSTLNDLKGAVLDLAYSDSFSFTDSEGNDITPINVPYLDLGNGYEACMPMFGMATSSSISKSGNKAIVTLERLFAKVNLTVQLALNANTGILNRARFALDEIALSNLPEYVAVVNDGEQSWASEEGLTYSLDGIGVTIFDGSQIGDGTLNRETEYSCICYVPEFILDNNVAVIDKEINKPSNFDNDKFPVYMTVSGQLIHDNFNDGNPVDFTYTLYLGRDNTDDFSLIRNKSYNYKMTITGINDARLETDERVEATFNTTDLAAEESANCYIISQIGRYSFPAVKGNTEESVGEIPTDENGYILKSCYDISVTDNATNTITNVKLVDGQITFDVNMDTFKEVVNGNTMFIVKDEGGNVLWSWHLWFDGGVDALTNDQNPISEELYNTGYTMMNRNLGSASQRGAGFYYKWGDKSPFFKGAYQGGITGGEWGATKSVTDPCPPGYKVPSSNVWSDSPNEATIWGPDFFTYEGSPLVLYPYSSYLIGNELVVIKDDTLYDKDGNDRLWAQKQVTILRQKYDVGIYYSGTQTTILGEIWATNGAFYYDTESYTFNSNTVDIFYKKSSSSSWSPRNPSGGDGYDISSMSKIPLVGSTVVNAVNSILQNLKTADKHFLFKDLSETENLELPPYLRPVIPSHGLQVRCVKE